MKFFISSINKHPLIVLSSICSVLLVLSTGCPGPSQVDPGGNYCSAGASVFSIDDSNVTQAEKDMIYLPPPSSGYINTTSPDYNASGRTVVIPLNFPDVPINTALNKDTIRAAFFGSAIGSAKDFFFENSWGQFVLTEGGISDPVTLSRKTNGYSTWWLENANFLSDACQGSSINWASLDVNGDKIIAQNEVLICFVFSGGILGATRPNTTTINYNGQIYTIQNRFVSIDCKRNDATDKSVDMLRYNYSTLWHEMAHGFFALPDRYVDSTCARGKTGPYDLMSDNCKKKHLTAYDKMKIGWLRPRILTPETTRVGKTRNCYNFQAIERSPAALVLYDSDHPYEFWIVENKNIASSAYGFESELPESGLAIWWVNTTDVKSLTLLQFNDPGKKPSDYNNPNTGALYKYKDGQTAGNMNVLTTADGKSFPFGIRAISPTGASINAEF